MYLTLLLFCKIKNKLSPPYLQRLLPQACGTSSRYHLRGHKFPVPTVRSSRALKAVIPKSIILWNDLPGDIKADRKYEFSDVRVKFRRVNPSTKLQSGWEMSQESHCRHAHQSLSAFCSGQRRWELYHIERKRFDLLTSGVLLISLPWQNAQ